MLGLLRRVFARSLLLVFPARPRPTPPPKGKPPDDFPQKFHFGHGRTILVINDEPLSCAIVHLFLGQCGFHVLVAQDVVLGLTLYLDNLHQVEVVIMDITAPGLCSTDVVPELRLLKPDIRIVALANPAEFSALMPQEAGRLAWVGKPMNARELIVAVQSVLV